MAFAARSGPVQPVGHTGRHRAEHALALGGTTGTHAHLGRPRRRAPWLTAAVVVVVAVVAWLVIGGEDDVSAPRSLPPAQERVHVSIEDDGDVRVDLELTWAAERDDVEVAVPEHADDGFHPSVLLSESASGDDGGALDPGDTRTVSLAEPVTSARLDYSATGTFVATAPSTSGRGLVLLTPLVVEEPDAPLHLSVKDSRVENLACTSPGSSRACGANNGDTWTVPHLRPGEDVVAQVTMRAGR